MVIMFRGTNISRNNAPQTLALFAGLTVVKFGRKTLILQLSTNYSVEEYLIGKQIKDQAIQSEINMFDDVGIDAMLRRVETQKIDAKHFSTFCQELYAEPNMFDLALRSKKEDFEEEIVTRERDIAKLLVYAKEVYDDIYILVDGKRDKLVGILNKLVDKSFICVPQGNVQEFTAMSDHSIILVTNFDSRSSYDLKSMQKRYGVGEIASIPFDVSFRDFCCSKNLIRFIMTNDKVGPWDDNYALFSSVSSIIEKIHDGELMELGEPAFIFKEKGAKGEKSESKIHYSNQNVGKEVQKKGFFRKRETVTVHFSEKDQGISSPDEMESGHKSRKEKRPFGKKKTNSVPSVSLNVDPENYDEFSDLEKTIEDTFSVESSEENEEFIEGSAEEYEEEDGLEEYEEEDLDSEEYEEEDSDSEEYEEEDSDSEEYEEDADSEDTRREDTSAPQSQAKKQQELLDYIRKYCEDRKFRLNKTDLKSIEQKPFVLDYFDEWKKEYVTNLWKEFESIPIDSRTDVIMDNWQEFPAGTGKEVIRSWFVYNYGAELMDPIMSVEKDNMAAGNNTGKKRLPRKKRKMKHA